MEKPLHEEKTLWVVLLTAAMIWGIPFIDTIAAIISSFVIVKWWVGLLKDSGTVLLDIEKKQSGQGPQHKH